jgi:hypothetical protein
MIDITSEDVTLPLEVLRGLLSSMDVHEVKEMICNKVDSCGDWINLRTTMREEYNRIALAANLQVKCPVGRR